MKNPHRFYITKGYVQIPHHIKTNGKEIEVPGGFIEDWEKGKLWAFIDTKNDIAQLFSFKHRPDAKFFKDVEKYVKEQGAPE